MHNIINLKTHPLYIKKKIKDKTLNLFGAPIPEDTIISHYEIFEKLIIQQEDKSKSKL